MKIKVLFLLLIVPFLAQTQSTFSGVIKDSKTKEPLPFATIITNINTGEISDAEGKFFLKSKLTITHLTISYIGYKTKKISINEEDTFLTILLDPSKENLDEVVINARENPALKIITNAIKSRKKNNIETALNSFKYLAYNKLLVTAEADSINGKIDSVFVLRDQKKVFKRIDSSNYTFKKQIEKQHLYITEKVAEHTFKRGKNKKETILASRMAGFKTPIYEVLALNIENFTFYDEVYRLMGNNYVNPLAKNALNNYTYKILDTVKKDNQEAYMIYYKYTKKQDFVGLQGVLYIDSKSFALQKGIAELKGIINVKATQEFNYKPNYNIWFPKETVLKISKGKDKENVNLFGGVIKFSTQQKNDSILKTNKKDPSDVSYLLSRTTISDVIINEPIKIINSASIIEIDDNASNRDELFWNKYRTDTLSKRGINAYKVIDSTIQKEGVEKKINIGRKVLKGYFPTKYFDFNLSQLINFNNYEGFRFGFGGITNNTLSNVVRFSGYMAYGFKDKKIKYNLGGAIRLNKNNNTWFNLSYTDDIHEAAKIDFLFEDTSFSLINPRNLNIGQFYGYKTYSAGFEHDIFPNLESKLKFRHGKYDTKFNYQYISDSKALTNFELSLLTFAVKWTPFSRYMNSPIGKLTVKNSWPKINAQVTKSIDGFLNSDFDFTQFNIKAEHSIKALKNSSTSFLLQGGVIFGDAPLTHLYNATPNYSLKNPWRKRINFSGTNAFETMTFNEFISDRYVMLQARHNLERFNIGNKFKPRLSLISRFAIGTIDNPEFHQGVEFKSMEKGYLESGFVLNHLFKGFGISSFYRYGPYSNDKISDNLAVKLTYVLSLGF